MKYSFLDKSKYPYNKVKKVKKSLHFRGKHHKEVKPIFSLKMYVESYDNIEIKGQLIGMLFYEEFGRRKSMSFKDELSASMKTPQQVEKEREDATIIEIKKHVQWEIASLKKALKDNASNGNYRDLGNRKIIIAEVSTGLRQYCEINSRQGTERKGFFGNDIHTYYTVTCNYSSSKYTRIYLEEIKKLLRKMV